MFDLFEEFFDLNDDGEVDVFEYGVEVVVVTESMEEGEGEEEENT